MKDQNLSQDLERNENMSALKEILDRNYSIVIDKKCPAGYVSIEIYDSTCTQIESYLIRDFLLCEEDCLNGLNGFTIEYVLEDMMIRIRKKELKCHNMR